jgi:hypothetical protein
VYSGQISLTFVNHTLTSHCAQGKLTICLKKIKTLENYRKVVVVVDDDGDDEEEEAEGG